MGILSLGSKEPSSDTPGTVNEVIVHAEDDALHWVDQVFVSRVKAYKVSFSIFRDVGRYFCDGVAVCLRNRSITPVATDSWMRAGKYLLLAITCLFLSILTPRAVVWLHSSLGLMHGIGVAIKIIKFAYQYRYLLASALLFAGSLLWYRQRALSIAINGENLPPFRCFNIPGLTRICWVPDTHPLLTLTSKPPIKPRPLG